MEGLEGVVRALRARYRLHAVILFGSRARGDWGPWSDYDILILADFDEPYPDRIRGVLEALKDVRLPVEPHPYTVEEAVEMLRRGCPTVVDALEEGVVLYSSGRLGELRALYEDMRRRGLRRSRTTIVLPG